MLASGVSFVGRRSNNEDTFRVCRDLGLYLVADGMGGHEGGEVASRLAAEAVTRFFAGKRDGTNPAIDLDDPTRAFRHRMNLAIRQAQREVEAAARGDLAEMGTTLAALWLRGPLAIVAHVGDSRVYRCRGGVVEALTRDHSYVEQMRAAGMAPARHLRHLITRAVGSDRGPPELRRVDARAGDTFLLCTDGLSDVLGAGHIRRVLARTYAPERSAEALVHEALRRGTQDNVTALVVRID